MQKLLESQSNLALLTFEKYFMENKRYPIPPFTMETALQKVQAAQDAWNTKDPEKVSLEYTVILNGEIGLILLTDGKK